VADLESAGALVKVEPYSHNVGTCYRCHTTVEPLVSKQWFVDMKPLAKPAIEAVRSGEVRFVPERFDKTYYNWMENIRDWCISRQLRSGHRIPAYYCDACGETIVQETAPSAASGGVVAAQDEDGWIPGSAAYMARSPHWATPTDGGLKYFYLRHVVTDMTSYSSGSRAMMCSAEVMQEKPFDTVYVHGIVRDSQGRKLSNPWKRHRSAGGYRKIRRGTLRFSHLTATRRQR
jgi:valyl-tRNA synthetase